jgi:hypothetical protein
LKNARLNTRDTNLVLLPDWRDRGTSGSSRAGERGHAARAARTNNKNSVQKRNGHGGDITARVSSRHDNNTIVCTSGTLLNGRFTRCRSKMACRNYATASIRLSTSLDFEAC